MFALRWWLDVAVVARVVIGELCVGCAMLVILSGTKIKVDERV